MADFEFTITETPEIVDLEEYFNYLIIEHCSGVGAWVSKDVREFLL